MRKRVLVVGDTRDPASVGPLENGEKISAESIAKSRATVSDDVVMASMAFVSAVLFFGIGAAKSAAHGGRARGRWEVRSLLPGPGW